MFARKDSEGYSLDKLEQMLLSGGIDLVVGDECFMTPDSQDSYNEESYHKKIAFLTNPHSLMRSNANAGHSYPCGYKMCNGRCGRIMCWQDKMKLVEEHRRYKERKLLTKVQRQQQKSL
jgi:hypothetical protein